MPTVTNYNQKTAEKLYDKGTNPQALDSAIDGFTNELLKEDVSIAYLEEKFYTMVTYLKQAGHDTEHKTTADLLHIEQDKQVQR